MRILFALRHPSYLRNFVSVVQALADEGHHVHLVFHLHGPLGEDALFERLASESRRITGQFIDEEMKAAVVPWKTFAANARHGTDYLRYVHPRFAKADALRARARKRAPAWVQQIGDRYLSRSRFALEAALKSGSLVEWSIPPHPVIAQIVESFRPDVVMSTPVVDMGSVQVDWFKMARVLGIPSVLPAASWDNLTNKGRLRVKPDRIFVWNEAQKDEAVAFHGVRSKAVKVCGAWSYDHWFDWRPKLDRTAFLQRVGLDPAKRYLLYVGSSPFIAPNETAFCKRIIAALRENRPTRDLSVLIRPHPQNAAQWEAFGNLQSSDVVVYPRSGANPITADLQSDYFDTIWHSEAVFGINTSAQVESGIIGRPVLTVTDAAFKDTQSGTLHFHHLTGVNGGLLHVARNAREHAVMLGDLLTKTPDERSAKSVRFTQAFIRPNGLDKAVAPIFVEALREVSEISPPAARLTRTAARLLRERVLSRYTSFTVADKTTRYVRSIAAQRGKGPAL